MKYAWLSLLLAGCASAAPTVDGVAVRDAYNAASAEFNVTVQDPAPLAAHKEIPVYYPPEIFAVYVPAQISRERDIMVGDHWIFMKLKDGSWYPEKTNEELRAKKQAADADVDLAKRRLAGARFVVPHE
jgi:hypothetical protein